MGKPRFSRPKPSARLHPKVIEATELVQATWDVGAGEVLLREVLEADAQGVHVPGRDLHVHGDLRGMVVILAS